MCTDYHWLGANELSRPLSIIKVQYAYALIRLIECRNISVYVIPCYRSGQRCTVHTCHLHSQL